MGKKKKKNTVAGVLASDTGTAWAFWDNNGIGGSVLTGTNTTNNIVIDAPKLPTCSACKQDIQFGSVQAQYSGPKVSRTICHSCYVRALDKLYGVEINADLEDVLYKDK